MKDTSRTLLCAALFILLTVWPIAAQEKQSQDADLLRAKIEQFEKTDISSKSSSVQSIYQRTLLRLYNQFNSSLKQDLADLKAMQEAVSGTNSESQKEIALQIQKLAREQNEVAEKIQTLSDDLKIVAASESRANGTSTPTTSLAVRPANYVSGNEAINTAKLVSSIGVLTNDDRSGRGNTTASVEVASTTPSSRLTADAFRQPNSSTSISSTANIPVRDSISSTSSSSALLGNAAPAPISLTVTGSIISTLEEANISSGAGDQGDYMQISEARRKGATERKYYRTAAAGSKGVCSTGNYFRQCLVTLKDLDKAGDNKIVTQVYTNNSGQYTITFNGEPDHRYELSTSADDFGATQPVMFNGQTGTINVDLPIEDRPVSLLTRTIIGYEQGGASSAASKQKFFFDFYISNPIPILSKINPDFGERTRMWGDIRVASIPQPGTSEVGAFAANFAQEVSKVKVGDVAQALEFLAGVEVRLTGNNSLLPSFSHDARIKGTLSFVAGFGTITPINPLSTIETFKISPDAPGLPPIPAGKEFISFVSSDRDRFFRQYYAGLRFQTFFFNRYDRPKQRFPGMFDIMYGQNEFVTGGRLRGGVFRLDGFFPLPFENAKFINLFGTALLRPTRTKITDPLILQPAPAGTVVPASNVLIVTTPQINRDYYRVGVGVDAISLIQKILNPNPAK